MSSLNKLNRSVIFVLALGCVMLNGASAQAQIYANKYAISIGISEYQHPYWKDLTYARRDAEGVAKLMQQLGFTVYTLYDAQATRSNIISLLLDELAPRLQTDDAVLFFYAGHGMTRRLDDLSWGYIAPNDASDKDASLISVEELQTLSLKMGRAKHHLFILDCCFGGLLGIRYTKGNVNVIPENYPHYLEVISSRKARLALTAGGEDQLVADGGPDGHSQFTFYLIKGISEGQADSNRDGWITSSELSGYMVPAASDWGQTPFPSYLPKHEGGEFLFKVPTSSTDISDGPRSEVVVPPPVQRTYSMRTTPRENLSKEEAGQMLRTNGFYARKTRWNKDFSNENSTGIDHSYRRLTKEDQLLVIDDATGLMWQQSGSPNRMTYSEVEEYVRELNKQYFAGWAGWRLPTLEEAMSLMETERKNGHLYIDASFATEQAQIWTSDKIAGGYSWFVNFEEGACAYGDPLKYVNYVRAVRLR